MKERLIKWLGLDERIVLLEEKYKTLNITFTSHSNNVGDEYLSLFESLGHHKDDVKFLEQRVDELEAEVRELKRPKHWWSR